MVFTYLPQRGGPRRPLTYDGVKTPGAVCANAPVWSVFASTTTATISRPRCCARPGTEIGARMLNHTDIKSTLRYAHVNDSEVAEAMERVAKSRLSHTLG